jgi:hypothetical protein
MRPQQGRKKHHRATFRQRGAGRAIAVRRTTVDTVVDVLSMHGRKGEEGYSSTTAAFRFPGGQFAAVLKKLKGAPQ